MIVCMDRVTLRMYAVRETLLDGQFSIFASKVNGGWGQLKSGGVHEDLAGAVQALLNFRRKKSTRRWAKVDSIDGAMAVPCYGSPNITDYIPPETMKAWERKKNG